jgi:nicotinate dehydrogenase subunit A
VAFDLVVNGVACSLASEGDTPLLYGLRDELKLKGTRFGCGAGHCGACTVTVDGRAVQACDTPLWSVAGRKVATAEGLDADPVGRVVREAFIEHQAAQCGFCSDGILMSTTALLHQIRKPDRAAINRALERNLCRCGTHVRILRAIDLAIARLNGGRQ